MLDDVAPKLRTGAKMVSRTIRVERPEGVVAAGLGRVQERFEDVSMGSYPFFRKDKLGTHLVLRTTNETRLEEAVEALWEMLREEGFADHAREVDAEEAAD